MEYEDKELVPLIQILDDMYSDKKLYQSYLNRKDKGNDKDKYIKTLSIQ